VDESNMAAVSARIASLQGQQRQASLHGDIYGINRMAGQTLGVEITRLQEVLAQQKQQETAAIVDAIIQANQGNSADAIAAQVEETLALRERFGLSQPRGTKAGFQSMQVVRF
jgi:hypothetical protein